MATAEIEPRWLKSVHTHGLDHLGLQIVSITMYGDLLPGLTNVTDRIRYYSFFPWLLHRYANDVGSTSVSKWQEHLRRAEFLLALIGKAHHEGDSEGGEAIAGADQATKTLALFRDDPNKGWNLSEWTALAQAGEKDSYFKNKNGGYGQYYRGTLSDLGVISIVDSSLGIQLNQDSGVKIAEICDAQPGRQEFWQAVLDDAVSLELVESLGDLLCPCALTSFEEECQFLAELMFGPDLGSGGTTNQRANTLRLLLAFLDQFDGAKEPVSAFREIAYYGHSETGNKFLPPPTLADDLEHWLIYQAGEYVHYSLEQAFLAILRVLKGTDPTDSGLDGFVHRLATEALAASSESLGLGTNAQPWADRLMADLIEEAQTAQKPIEAWSQDPWAESKLVPNAKDGDAPYLLAKAFACVLSVIARSQLPATPFSGFRSLDSSFLQRYSANVASFRDFVLRNKERKAVDVYAEILSNWVIGQHIRVAMRKLRSQTQATFKIGIEEGRYVWIEDFEPTYTSPRLRQAFRFLRDLGLCGGASDGWGITEAGKHRLEEANGE